MTHLMLYPIAALTLTICYGLYAWWSWNDLSSDERASAGWILLACFFAFMVISFINALVPLITVLDR
jgi:hypothetical protein